MNPTFKINSVDAAHLLEGLVNVNQAQHRRLVKKGNDPFTVIKAIQDGKIVYKRSDPDEHWQTYKEMVEGAKKGSFGADCEDLSAAVVAELRNAGIDARTYVFKARPGLYHVIVKTEKWGFIDPSVSAGMKKV